MQWEYGGNGCVDEGRGDDNNMNEKNVCGITSTIGRRFEASEIQSKFYEWDFVSSHDLIDI